MGPRGLRVVVVALMTGSLLGPSRAAADGLSLYVEPDYSHTTTRITDQLGNVTASGTDEVAQHYRLTLDRLFAPLVRLTADGLFDQRMDWLTTNGVPSRADEWSAGGDALLYVGSPVLSTVLGYSRHDDSLGGTLMVGRLHDVSEVYSVDTGWRPIDLPALDLRLSRTHDYDVDHRMTDLTVDSAVLNGGYNPFRQLRLDYYGELDDTNDHLGRTDTRSITNGLRAMYQDTFNEGRSSAMASYSFMNRTSDTVVSGTGGLVATPQLALAGLSGVELFPATPYSITLAQNPALVDSNITVSANVDLGYSVALAGDVNPRELGLQFADPTTAVNALYVFVDRQLPLEISGVFRWTAWRSDDNVTWTPVTLAGPVVFGAFQNRFEISIEETRARYLKVVATPLPPTVTADRRFSDIFVTDLQAFLVVPAAQAHGTSSFVSHTANAALHHQLLDTPMLAYDFAGNLSTGTGGTTYVMLNGISAQHELARAVIATARLARQDTGGAGLAAMPHLGVWQYSAGITAAPLPALNHALTYTGQHGQTPAGTMDQNEVMFMNRAQFYTGVDAQLGLGYGKNTFGPVSSSGPLVMANLNVVPNRMVTLSSSYYYSSLVQSGLAIPQGLQENEQINGTASFSPVPAIYLSATITRIIKGPQPTTLTSFGGSFSPFPDGALLLRAAYTESENTVLGETDRVATATARWVIAPPAWLEVDYSILRSTSTFGSSDIRTFTVSLVIQL